MSNRTFSAWSHGKTESRRSRYGSKENTQKACKTIPTSEWLMSAASRLRSPLLTLPSTYRPKHPLYERLNPTPPLLVNGLLFLLAVIISAGAFKDYNTIEAVLDARPPPRRRFMIMEWADAVLDDPVFPEMSADGATKKVKNESAWGTSVPIGRKGLAFQEGWDYMPLAAKR